MNEQKIVIVVQSFLLQILMDTFQGFQGSRRRCLENMSGESISNT
jgi:ABC-type nitrate/sulfonate/bicarbonate transport system permease component